jgi:hypothetical protein
MNGIEFNEEVPPFVKEFDVHGRAAAARRVVPTLLADAPPHGIVSEIDPLLRAVGGRGNHAHKPVFGVPKVVPTPVLGQVPVRVVGEGFGGAQAA